MTKFGQAEYSDFMARVFADKLDCCSPRKIRKMQKSEITRN